MALKRATKSLPLSGGIMEEVDDFLLEPAGMQYVENARFTKKDTVEKARAYAAGVATGVANYDPAINAFWSDGGQQAAVVGNNEVAFTYDGGATWEKQNDDYDIVGIERILATAEQGGGTNFSYAPIGQYTDTTIDTYYIWGYLVAFERVDHTSGSISNQRDVVIQTYDTNGNLLDEVIELNHSGPQCYPLADFNGFAGVVYTQNSNGNLKGRISSISSIGSITNNDPLNIQLVNQNLLLSNGLLCSQNYGDLRMGWSVDLQANNSSLVAYHSHSNGAGIIGWKDDVADAIKIRFMSLGYPQGTSYTIVTDALGATHNAVLDVYLDEENNYAYALVSQLNVILKTWSLKVYQFDIGTFSVNYTHTIESNVDRVPVNGSIRRAADGTVYVACTKAQGFPDKSHTMQETAGYHHVAWWRLSDGDDWSIGAPTNDNYGLIFNHRLCSNIEPDKDSECAMVVQQWDNWNPTGKSGTATWGVTPTAKKPVTSIMVVVGNTDNSCRVAATFDAGQSKAQLFGQDEQSTHKSGNLYYFNNHPTSGSGEQYHRFHYGNRILLTADDTFYWMDKAAAPTSTMPATPNSDGRAALSAGSARFAVYHINSTVPVHYTNFPDGAAIGASVPCWYDAKGQAVMSAGPLDSPEILTITKYGTTDGCSYQAYQDLAVTNEEPKRYVAMWVYSDAAGRIHRSAPSAEVYSGKLQADRTTTTRISVHVTSPIFLQRAKGTVYLEIYEAVVGGAFQLCDVTPLDITTLDGSAYISTEVGVNMNPTAAASGETDIIEYRGSKLLYTEGNVLAADPWPNFDFVVKSGRRMWGHSISDPNTIYYSKIFEQQVAPEFSASLTLTLGNQQITAMGTIDDKLIVWTTENMWVVYGPGPDNTGANGDFFVEPLTHKLGCTDQRSVITYSEGIAFYSNTTGEFHVIGRDLNIVDIGQAVKGMSAGITKIRGAVVDGGEHELQWWVDGSWPFEYLPAGTLLSPAQPSRPRIANQPSYGVRGVFVYNFKYGKWTFRTLHVTITNGIALGGVQIVDNKVGTVSDSYVFRKQADDVWYWSELMKWETPWIKVNQLQDFGRFYRATILGKYLSSWSKPDGTNYEAGDLQVTVHYDYEGADGTTSVHRWRANQDFKGGGDARFQMDLQPARQKCQAIKFVIEEIPTEGVEVWEPAYTTGQGFVLTAVDLEYGAKVGSGRKSLGAGRHK